MTATRLAACLAGALSALLSLAPPATASGPGAFFLDVATRETVTEAAAVQAVAILAGERQDAGDPAACAARLLTCGYLTGRDSYDPGRRLQKGFAALLFVRAMKLRGGLSARILGWGRLTAYRELEFRELVPPYGAANPMTGAELVSLYRLADEYVRTHRGKVRR